MQVLRTPSDRFSQLPDFSYAPHYIDQLSGYMGMRMHYVDEGPAHGDVALCLHGQPTWSYLYRKMIPALVKAGYRVIAPDLFGFGRSDKPADDGVYTFSFHRASLQCLVAQLDLRRITLVCQDWGGLLGLTLPMDAPWRYEKLLVMNTGLGTGDHPLGEGFLAWRAFNNRSPDMDIAGLMKRAVPGITEAEAQAYAAPFPDQSYKAGVRRFPNLVPDNPQADGAEISRRAREFWKSQWTGQSYMAIGMKDPVLGAPVMQALRRIIRGCPEPLQLDEAGHFVQEAGPIIVEHALKYFRT